MEAWRWPPRSTRWPSWWQKPALVRPVEGPRRRAAAPGRSGELTSTGGRCGRSASCRLVRGAWGLDAEPAERDLGLRARASDDTIPGSSSIRLCAIPRGSRPPAAAAYGPDLRSAPGRRGQLDGLPRRRRLTRSSPAAGAARSGVACRWPPRPGGSRSVGAVDDRRPERLARPEGWLEASPRRIAWFSPQSKSTLTRRSASGATMPP